MGEGREEKDTDRDRECNSGCLEVWVELIDIEFKDNCFFTGQVGLQGEISFQKEINKKEVIVKKQLLM